MTGEVLRCEVPLKCQILVSEYHNGERIRFVGFTVYNKHPCDIQKALTQILGDDVRKRKVSRRPQKNEV